MSLSNNDLIQLKNLLLTCNVDNFALIKSILKGKRIAQKKFFELLKLSFFNILNFKDFEEAYYDGIFVFHANKDIWQYIQAVDFAPKFYLYYSTVLNLDFFPYWEKLKLLLINDAKIENIAGLEKCPNLTSFELKKSIIEDLSPLQKLKNLTSLSLDDLPNVNMLGLKQITFLRSLYLFNINQFDLSHINALSLYILSLNWVDLYDFKLMPYLPNLYLLNVNHNKLADLNGLANCANIEHLDAENNLLTNIDIISEMPKLKFIKLSNNKINQFNFSPNQSIKELNLSNNPLESLNSIEQLTELNTLLLIDCPPIISHWDKLTLLPALKKIIYT